jgi:hypothetical protein
MHRSQTALPRDAVLMRTKRRPRFSRMRRPKTDTVGEGATAYLSPLTMRLVPEWLRAAAITVVRGWQSTWMSLQYA